MNKCVCNYESCKKTREKLEKMTTHYNFLLEKYEEMIRDIENLSNNDTYIYNINVFDCDEVDLKKLKKRLFDENISRSTNVTININYQKIDDNDAIIAYDGAIWKLTSKSNITKNLNSKKTEYIIANYASTNWNTTNAKDKKITSDIIKVLDECEGNNIELEEIELIIYNDKKMMDYFKKKLQ